MKILIRDKIEILIFRNSVSTRSLYKQYTLSIGHALLFYLFIYLFIAFVEFIVNFLDRQ